MFVCVVLEMESRASPVLNPATELSPGKGHGAGLGASLLLE